MIRSMYSGVSGMAAHQTKLNVIGNNIANVNTNGFKASRVVFSDVLYQNLSTAAAPNNSAGGVNASQLGYGTKVGTIDVINSLAAGADTGRALDVYINGEGYLPVQTSDGASKFTRVGNLKFDIDGNLTDGNGSLIMGIPIDATGNPVLGADGTLDVDGLEAINVDPAELEKCTGISIGVSGEITAIKDNVPVTLGYLAVAKFANPEGLNRDGDGYYQESSNSGDAVATKAGTQGTGNIKSSSLEMSNVDLSKEFTEMIIAQRGFQANSRLVTVSDTILEELINLKR